MPNVGCEWFEQFNLYSSMAMQCQMVRRLCETKKFGRCHSLFYGTIMSLFRGTVDNHKRSHLK